MYRMGPSLASLLTAARKDVGHAAPFDLALYLLRRLNTSHAHANPRVYSIGAMIAKEHMLDAAYYGPSADVAFVHVPRRLRVPAFQAVISRINPNRTAVAIVVPMSGGDEFGQPGDLLANVHASLEQAGMGDQTLYIALDRAGFTRALKLGPFRVVLAGAASGGPGKAAPMTAAALRAAASFSDASVSLLVIGPSAVTGGTSLRLALAGTNATATDTLSLQARAAAPLVMSGEPPLLDVGAMVVPGKRQASAFLRAWASAAEEGKRWTWTAAGVSEAVRGGCSMVTETIATQHASSPAPCTGLQVATLPAELFQAAATLQSPLWSAPARRAVAALVTAGPDPDTAAFHLRQAGLWRLGDAGGNCTTYSAVAHGPLPIADLATTHLSLSTYAAFFRFAGRQRLACGVLPGFAVRAAGGRAVPYDTVLHRERVVGTAAPGMLAYPRVSDVGHLPYEAFVLAQPEGRPIGTGDAFAAIQGGGGRAHSRLAVEPSRRSGPSVQDPPTTPHALTARACAAFNLPGTTCFTQAVAADVEAAAHALQQTHAGPLHCVADARRAPAEVAVLGLEGRTGDIRDVAAALAGPAPATVLLTGAWRTLPAGAFQGGRVREARPPASNRTRVITLADLIWKGRLTTIDDLPVSSPDEAAGLPQFADLVEYALCQGGAVAVHDLAPLLPPSPSPADLALRVAAHIPPDRLAADLSMLATWLDRPDRPSLGGRVLWARWPASRQARPADAVDGVTSALNLADAAGVPLVGLPAAWSAAFGHDPAALHVLHSTARNLLPPSVAVLLDPERIVDAARGWSSPVSRNAHPASVDAVLANPRHAAALGAVQRVLQAKANRGDAAAAVHVAMAGAPLPRGRMRGLRPLVRANEWGVVMDFGVGA